MANGRQIRYRRGFKQAIPVPSNIPAEIKPWAISMVREVQSLRDDLERLRRLVGEEPFRKQ